MTVWVLLPRNWCIIYGRVKYRGVVGLAIVTPDSKNDALIEEIFAFGAVGEIAAEILDEYDRLTAVRSPLLKTWGVSRQ